MQDNLLDKNHIQQVSSFTIMLEEFKNGVKNLSPAYFAIVMATGIISTGSFLMDMNRIANFLFVLNNIFYIIMWALTILRLVWYSKSLIKDLTDHMSGTGFFTIVAGTCVLGIQYIIMFEFFEIALALLILGIFLWLFLTYAVFTTLTIKQDKPTLDKGITGGWLTAIVATQSVSILSALIASHIKQPYRIEVNFFALSMWLWGGMFYIWMISLIFYRYTFFKFSPGDLAPPYWINMGAMAISTLAGSLLIINAPDAPLLESLLPFLKGFTVFYWATGTWWIPMLIILAIWRHIYKRYPLKYDSLYWGAVFPQGMYAVCTFRMSEALEIPFLHYFYNAFIYIALIAWALTFSGLIRHFLAEFAKVKLKINAMKNQV
ncbi:MAG: tellurite resistance/C4-dicarboxylate transporter family protein [Chitinophagales bacterium]|nr:tellurite resistance/C4-dicarboxylate transporter family protein [Chitinophagales bacterium]MBP8752584.1 tellurite resistance/C4-dicarboxylate transporter family protein [Chitinophagales bacterium]MBP9187946.1 tellurite resistance/C4-dicarboxylate transporter family protein [Chitinophagales bacterium]MBP9549122.1 tellurite resistance/C4-dicarboxylate transporter family protein [Chitinophagales bacterium]MBP9704438.1 tellurite resistance/C4-dicarboxylate transporter family protein [Chitinopha